MSFVSMNRLADKLSSQEETFLNADELTEAIIALRWAIDCLETCDTRGAGRLLDAIEDSGEVTLGPTDSTFLAKVLRACALTQPSKLCMLRIRTEAGMRVLLSVDHQLQRTPKASPEFDSGIAARAKIRFVLRGLLASALGIPPDAAHVADRRAIAEAAERLLDPGDTLISALNGLVGFEAQLPREGAKPSLPGLYPPSGTDDFYQSNRSDPSSYKGTFQRNRRPSHCNHWMI